MQVFEMSPKVVFFLEFLFEFCTIKVSAVNVDFYFLVDYYLCLVIHYFVC